ncbi:MAG: MutS-related protein, partial [Plesiomonas shigelloides]
QAMTLFATHYFELTALPERLEGVSNVHLDAVEHGETIAFMHAVQEGAASKSYGLAVAALAGVPRDVIRRARQKLHELESQPQPESAANASAGSSAAAAPQLSLLPHPVIDELEALNPDNLSARQALDLLYRLKAML